jgi:integrase
MGIHKTQVIQVNDEINRALSAWLETLDQFGGGAWEWIFVRILKSDQVIKHSLKPRHVRNIVAECGYKADLSPRRGNNRLTPTDLRRTCGRNAYDNGARLLDVQALLGHSKPISTARFIGVHMEINPNKAVNRVKYSS